MSIRNLVNRRLPYQLGFRPSGGSAPFDDPKGAYDISIGGIPFLLASGHRQSAYLIDRYYRKTAQFQRDQLDTSREPGEQSLTGWWLRSQSSFHLGAGQEFEAEANQDNPYRYDASEGVDVWTPGRVTLLSGTLQRMPDGSSPIVLGARDGTTDITLYADGTALTRLTASTQSAVTWGGTGQILSLTDDGANYYAADATSIYKGTLSGGAGAAAWNTGNSAVVIGWAKQRLMAGIGPSIYELAGGTPPTLPTPTYTHPNSSWVWTSITEGPDAIYVAGYAGGRSAIVKLALDTSGALPTLTQATTAAEMPTGEVIYAIYGYLGSFMAIGTSAGVRIAQIDSSGALAYGPLITSPGGAVRCFVGADRFIYAGWSSSMSDGTSGLIRIDLSQQLPDGRYAYATDLRAHAAGDVTGVALRGASGLLSFTVSGHGLYEQDAANLESQGWLKTYRVRYSTLWPKLFKRLSLRCSAPFAGTVAISTIDQTETEISIASVLPQLDPLTDITISSPPRPQIHIALRFTLSRSTGDPLQGPDLSGYQLKAIPGGPRPREYTIPVYVFDNERDRNGAAIGYPGWGISRLKRLEDLDSAGDTVLLQDLLSDQGELVVIENLEFLQQSPPRPGEVWGGVVTITCRTVTS